VVVVGPVEAVEAVEVTAAGVGMVVVVGTVEAVEAVEVTAAGVGMVEAVATAEAVAVVVLGVVKAVAAGAGAGMAGAGVGTAGAVETGAGAAGGISTSCVSGHGGVVDVDEQHGRGRNSNTSSCRLQERVPWAVARGARALCGLRPATAPPVGIVYRFMYNESLELTAALNTPP
jgi:hypothetical protein